VIAIRGVLTAAKFGLQGAVITDDSRSKFERQRKSNLARIVSGRKAPIERWLPRKPSYLYYQEPKTRYEIRGGAAPSKEEVRNSRCFVALGSIDWLSRWWQCE
jgi:hypothetical protein